MKLLQLLVCFSTYYESRRAHTSSSDAVAVGSVGAAAQLPAALAVVTCRTRLVTVKPRPSRCTGALSWQRVTAERAREDKSVNQSLLKGTVHSKTQSSSPPPMLTGSQVRCRSSQNISGSSQQTELQRSAKQLKKLETWFKIKKKQTEKHKVAPYSSSGVIQTSRSTEIMNWFLKKKTLSRLSMCSWACAPASDRLHVNTVHLFQLVWDLGASKHSRQLFSRTLQLCFTVKLQKCSVNFNTSPDVTSAQREETKTESPEPDT